MRNKNKTRQKKPQKQHLKTLLWITKDRSMIERCNSRPVTDDEQFKKASSCLYLPLQTSLLRSRY